MTRMDLSADCGRCAALCCMAFAFDKGRQFARDKAAGEPCSNLGRDGCRIYADRAGEGYGGCVQYHCQGAGQRVTQDLFQGADWRDDPSLRQPMAQAFAVVQGAHAVLALLRQAEGLPLSQADRDRLAGLETAIVEAGASPGAVAARTAEARGFLRSLQRYVERPAAG